ncbi:MAG: hypothetical protein EA397_04910 [Deltaproteobacteria bacterium]|nr:MAG: hypothetical protein EA397_04910 [Deltaproteobacteria bacterium]
MIRTTLLSVVLLGAGCFVDAAKVPSHQAFSGPEAQKVRPVSFAVVGSTRSLAYGAKAEPKAPRQLIEDVRTQVSVRGIDAVILTGGFVRRSTADEWSRFGKRWSDLLASERPSDNKARVPVLALPGASERLGDKRLVGFGAAFPGATQDIGLDRVASWGATDLSVDGTTWRLLFADTHRRALGSRWQEQLFWLPKAVSEGSYDRLLVFMPEPRITLAKGATMNRDGAAVELIEIIEEYAGLDKLTAVISGGPSTNELYLPTGSFGEAYLVAGNAGLSGPTLLRAGPADDAGFKDLGLEPGFDLALMRELDLLADAEQVPQSIVDKARARGSWETYTPRYDGDAFPVQGWWIVTLHGQALTLTYRARRADGTFHDVHTLGRGGRGGWKAISE